MPEEERYKLATFLADESDRPTVQELEQAISDNFSDREEEEIEEEDEPLVYKEKGRNTYSNTDTESSDYDYCHFRYVADTKESYRVRGDDDEEQDATDVRLTDARVIYFRNGQMAFESKQDMEPLWVPRFIMKITGYEDFEPSDWQMYNFGRDFMHDVYDNADLVSVLKLAEPNDTSDGTSELVDFVANIASEVSNLRFSAGNGGGNLKSRPAIDTCARNLKILNLRYKNDGGYTKEITSSGSFVTTWDIGEIADEDSDERQRQESIEMRKEVMPHLKRVIRLSD